MSKNIFYILIILAMISWGLFWPSAKVISSYIDAYSLVFLRMFICFITLIPVILFLKLSLKFDLKSLFFILIGTMLLVLYSIFSFWAVQEGTASIGGALIPTLIPISTFIILAIINKKTISLRQAFALVLGTFGVLNIIDIWHFDLKQIFSKDIIYCITSSLLWAFLTITSEKSSRISPFIFTFYTYLFSSVIIYAIYINNSLIAQFLTYDLKFWFNIFIISVVSGTFGTSVYFIGAKKLGSKNVSTFIFLVPISAIIGSSLFLGEQITFSMIIGTLLAILSIYILNNINILKYFKK